MSSSSRTLPRLPGCRRTRHPFADRSFGATLWTARWTNCPHARARSALSRRLVQCPCSNGSSASLETCPASRLRGSVYHGLNGPRSRLQTWNGVAVIHDFALHIDRSIGELDGPIQSSTGMDAKWQDPRPWPQSRGAEYRSRASPTGGFITDQRGCDTLYGCEHHCGCGRGARTDESGWTWGPSFDLFEGRSRDIVGRDALATKAAHTVAVGSCIGVALAIPKCISTDRHRFIALAIHAQKQDSPLLITASIMPVCVCVSLMCEVIVE